MNDDDIKNLLDGPAEDVKTRIAGTSHDDLLKIREAEQADQKRADVLLIIEAAITAAEDARAGGRVQMEPALGEGPAGDKIGDAASTSSAPLTDHHLVAADLDGSGPANVPDAVAFMPSGAPLQSVHQVDASHPAVDANPRANTTAAMNRIDFNDPVKTGAELAADNG